MRRARLPGRNRTRNPLTLVRDPRAAAHLESRVLAHLESRVLAHLESRVLAHLESQCRRADKASVSRNEFKGLLVAAVDGDSEAFAQIWRAQQAFLLRYLRVVAGDQADDLAAETWLDVVRQLRSFRGDEAGFRAWLVTIARHKLIDQRRREVRRPERLVADYAGLEPVAAGGPEGDFIEELSTAATLRLIATLPPDVAEMVSLRVIVGLDVADVARIVKRRPGTVRVAVHRGLQKLANQLIEGDVTHGATTSLPGRDD